MVLLAPFTATDIDLLISWIASRELLGQWAGSAFSYPLTRPQMKEHLRASSARGGLIFKVLGSDQAVIGHVEVGAVDQVHRSCRIGRLFVVSSHRGRGMCAQIMRAVLRLAFEELQMHRVELSVFDFNQRAVACYERVGFRREGLRREMFKSSDGYQSEIIMSILAPEWAVLHSAV